MKKLGYVPALDGLRGLAIAAVLLFHARLISSGFLGVDLFFVLSGFLITSLLLDERAERGTIALGSFYRRRVRRLMPVAIAGIVAGEALTLAVSGWDRELWPGVFALFYIENLQHYLLHPPVFDRLIQYWSLSQEEQFYLVWPPLLAFALRRRVSLAKMAYVLAGLAVVVMAHRAVGAGGVRLYSPDVRADGMLLGCALGAGWKAGLFRPSHLWRAAGVVAAVVFAADSMLLPTADQALYGIAVGTISATVMVAAIILEPANALPRLLELHPLRWLGKISYSVYIWNLLIGLATGLSGVPMIALSVGVGWVSYRLIEEPFRRRRPHASGTPVTLKADLARA